MKYLLVAEIAKKWNMSERSVRNYCAKGRVNGAFLTGKTWNIPENAEKPERINKRKEEPITLVDILKEQKASNVYTHIGFDDAEEELKRMEDFRKAQAEIEQKKEKLMSQKMFKVI